MTPSELISLAALIFTILCSCLGAAWFVGRRILDVLVRFARLEQAMGDLQTAVDANTHALNNGVRAEVRQHSQDIRTLMQRHASDLDAVRARLDTLPCHALPAVSVEPPDCPPR
jgi:hypothetical protein